VQGRLRGKPLYVTVESSCAHCGVPLVLKIDSELVYHVLEGGPEPMLFHPFVDFSTLPEPSIINAF
jgi:hypothetical protein